MHLHHIYVHSMDLKVSLNDYNKSKCKQFRVLLGPMCYCSIIQCAFVVFSLPPSWHVLAGAGFLCNTAVLLSSVIQKLLEPRFERGGGGGQLGHFKVLAL
jgi:hypothetical protein